MKISEMITMLQSEIEKRGDVEVELHGAYGASEKTFEVMKDEQLLEWEKSWLHIWTGINTG